MLEREHRRVREVSSGSGIFEEVVAAKPGGTLHGNGAAHDSVEVLSDQHTGAATREARLLPREAAEAVAVVSCEAGNPATPERFSAQLKRLTHERIDPVSGLKIEPCKLPVSVHGELSSQASGQVPLWSPGLIFSQGLEALQSDSPVTHANLHCLYDNKVSPSVPGSGEGQTVF